MVSCCEEELAAKKKAKKGLLIFLKISLNFSDSRLPAATGKWEY
jgi:hypothetical protein